MVADYKIYLTIGDVRVEMSNFISKLSLSFQHNLCSTSWKSVTDTASCTLQFNDRNIPQLAEVVSKLIEAQQAFPPEEVKFEVVSKDDETTYFYGYLDLGKLSVESSKLPGSVSLTAKSFMDKLDVKPHVNFVLYPSTVREVVEKCLVEAGFTDNIKWISSVGGMKVQVPFVVTEDDSDTWRDKIDTLLSEMGGYTLSYDHKDKSFFVSKVNDESKEVSDIPIRYHVQTKLKSTSTKYAKDGVVVSYGNLKTSKDQLVYIHNISLSQGDVLDPKGDEVEPGVYYPFDSDVTKTLEEYQTDLLDYKTLIGNTRKANEHISIYYVDPASTKVTIVASDMEGKGVSDWNDNQTFYSPEGGFTYPAGGAFYPRKAWFCFRNKSDKSVNLTRFSISGDTYYSDAEYKMVMPPDCKEPDEYSAKYIIDTETVRNFAAFLMNQKRFGGDTTTWTERWEDHEIGDKVEIQHKSGNIINAVIVRKESIIYGKELWAKITAVSTDGWSFEQPSLVQGSVHSPSLLDPYENAKRNGYTGSREQWESRNDIFYLWSSSETELKPKKRAFWKLGGKWMLFANLPIGDFGMQDWMNSWSEVMAERTEEYNYLWAKVGEDGEPFLLQGVKGDKGDNIISIIEYYISDYSSSLFGGYWGDTAENWIYGKYIWCRTKYINQETEEVEYSQEYYDSALTETYRKKLQWTFIVDPSIAKINRRLSVDDMVLSIYTNIQYYGNVIPIWKKNGEEFTGDLTISVRESGKVKIEMIHPTNQDICSSRYVEIVDETEQAIELSPVETIDDLPQRTNNGNYLVKGDYCIVKRTDGKFKPQLYEVESVDSNGIASWVVSKDSLKISSVTGKIVAIAKELKDKGEEIDYYDSLYAFNAYITNAFVEVLTVATLIGNDIKSSNFSPGEQGYRLRAKEGTLECMNGVFAGEVSVDHAFIYKGIFKTDRFYPQNF